MGGFLFFTLRFLLALFPILAINFPIWKWAANGAILGAFGYLMISGGSFATLRSFVMIAIFFLSILADQQVIALSNVALAALATLLVFPENVVDPGFQMSFAAVVGLVASYEVLAGRGGALGAGAAELALADHGVFRGDCRFYAGSQCDCGANPNLSFLTGAIL